MAVEPTPRTRRAVLAAAIGGTVATLAGAFRPTGARGANGDTVTVGGNFTGTENTRITNTASPGTAIVGVHTGVSGPATGVFGVSDSVGGQGVYGYATAATGTPQGVYGLASGATALAVAGEAFGNGTGVSGTSGLLFGFIAPSKTGVFGYAAQDAGSRGVVGQSAVGTGLHGYVGAGAIPAPASKTGVYGRCDVDVNARGVAGFSASGTGVNGGTTSGAALAGTASAAAGYALKTSGRLSIAKVSGVATLAAGNTSVPVNPGTDVTSSSYVLLTPQNDPGSRRLWATVDAVANTLTIRANVASASNLKVAWLLIG